VPVEQYAHGRRRMEELGGIYPSILSKEGQRGRRCLFINRYRSR